MTVQDLFITPIYLIFFTLGAYILRSFVTTPYTRKYFMPAFLLKCGGAIFLGLIYQFYYGGGDTFNYFTHGSRWIWEAFLSDPGTGLALLFEPGGERVPNTFEFSQHIWYYRDVKSFLIVRIAAFFDLFTLHTYSATALFFAAFSFSGLWAFYSALSRKFIGQYGRLAIAVLFIPSVVFWGSGILKDTITLGALGWLAAATFNIVENNIKGLLQWVIIIFMTLLILRIKSYIVICFVPTVSVWLFFKYMGRVRNPALKLLAGPVLVAMFGAAAVGSSIFISTEEYNINSFAEKAAVTAYDIRYGWGARTGGDGGYDLGGIPDGSVQSLVRLMPAAIIVSIFRPFPWEVRNPLMLLSALEALATFYLFLLYFKNKYHRYLFKQPFFVFCLSFALLFAFAVGISTYNFGTLMRYKIPMMPFLGLVLLLRPHR